MKQGPKRYHPFIICFQIGKYIKNAIIPFLFLFVLNYQSDMFVWKYGRYVFLAFTIWSFLSYIINWFFNKYELSDDAFYFYEGVFTKEERIIPYYRVQDIQQYRNVIHHILRHTSLRFETALSGENASITFPTLPSQQANNMKAFVDRAVSLATEVDEEKNEQTMEESNKQNQVKRTIHFTPSRQDLVFAFLTSFKFLALVPILLSIYFKVEGEFDLDKHLKSFQSFFSSAWWIAAFIVILSIVVSMLVGMTQTYLKYGKYEIASDEFHIYITQGLINESTFSIRKKNVQAVKIEQSLMKRLLGIAEIKFISAGSLEVDGEDRQVNALYPFLRKNRALCILHELLPEYEVGTKENIQKHPPQKLWLNLLKLSIVSLSLIGILYILEMYHVIMLPFWVNIGVWLLFVYFILMVYLHFRFSGYTHYGEWIHVQTGALATTIFITKRSKVIGVNANQSIVQKSFRLANIEIVNRANPVKYTIITHISAQEMQLFLAWFQQRTREIETE